MAEFPEDRARGVRLPAIGPSGSQGSPVSGTGAGPASRDGAAPRGVAAERQSAAARISDSASVTRARMFERIVSRPAQTALVAFEMEVSCDLS